MQRNAEVTLRESASHLKLLGEWVDVGEDGPVRGVGSIVRGRRKVERRPLL